MMHKILLLAIGLVVVSVNVEAQCFPNRHSTNFYDGWISCETAPNPNPARPDGHFIMYDYGKVYKLGQIYMWNTNDPARLEWGMQDVAIDYSLDGETWDHAGDYTIAQASGMSTYEGEEGPYLYEVEARYLLITGLSNYGGDCYGLSEVHVNAEEVVVTDVEDVVSNECVEMSVFPNPFTDKSALSVFAKCKGTARYSMYDALGHELRSGTFELTDGESRTLEVGRDLPSGAYVLFLEFGDKKLRRNLVKG